MKKLIYKILKPLKLNIIDTEEARSDFDDAHKKIWEKVSDYTMTSPERIFGLVEAVKYIATNNIEGSIVECGVWKGGSMMAIAETLLQTKCTNRQLYLFDTFEGMTTPTDADVDVRNKSAGTQLLAIEKKDGAKWCYSTLESVQQAMASTKYDTQKVHYVKGKVEDTIPGTLPDKIALLRLDTDWYESTKHEMNHLFPKLVKGGVLIIDDYGFWKGARKAIDEYIADNKVQILLCRMDNTGRIAIKQ